MKRPTMLCQRVLLNEGLQLDLAVDCDVATMQRRFEHEGMSFLTISLPSLCDALDQGLAQGRIAPCMFPGFKPWKRGGKLPAFMAGFFMRVFGKDGSLLPTPCIDAIRAIRQVTRLFKKVELPCSAARVKRAFERYKENDESVLNDDSLSRLYSSSFRAVTGYLWSDLEVLSGALYCAPGKYGTGATAERYSPNKRFANSVWPSRGEENFPSSYHLVTREDDRESLNRLRFLSEDEEEPVRVVQVPKTLNTPRIISVEPSYMMLRQQSVLGPLVEWLESGRLGFKSIRFTDQTVNKEYARLGSIDGSLATIDLSDASDLVSNDLVREIFRSAPTFLSYLETSRSTTARLPDGSLVKLRKFASMGSATCFPIEAMVFLTLIVFELVKQSGRVPSRRLISEITAKVSVYGDDIIVPATTAPGVCETLETFGLRVNRKKSFFTGLFRESCGGDYYQGHDVTPAYIRQWDFSGRSRDPRYIAGYTSLSNQFYLKGLWNASQYLRDHLESLTGRTFPRSTLGIGCLTFSSVFFNTGLKWCNRLHGYRVKGFALTAQEQDDHVDDLRGAMLLVGQKRGWALSGAQSERQTDTRESLGYRLDSPKRALDRALALIVHDDVSTTWAFAQAFLNRHEAVHSRKTTGGSELAHVSVRPYTLKSKYRWTPTRVGISSW